MADLDAFMARMRALGVGADEAAVRAEFGRPSDVKARDVYRQQEYGPVLVYDVNVSSERVERLLVGLRDGVTRAFWGEVSERRSTDDGGAALVARVRHLRRDGWAPETAEGAGDVGGSRFGGAPALAPGEARPTCGRCSATLPLLAQFAAAELPSAAAAPFGEGLLQVFYCTAEDADALTSCESEGGWEPFAPSTVVRILDAAGAVPGAAAAVDLAARRVVRWRAIDDLPEVDDAAAAGVNLSPAEADELDRNGFPRTGDKLLGWPAWVQGPERPPCPDCDDPMRELVQLASEDNVAHMFGDMGVGHVFRCESHPTRMTFTWACS